MEKLNVHLENCYGIRHLKQEFDFSTSNTYAIYAPNGVMKTSFAQTFRDVENGEKSMDRVHPERTTKRKIADQSDEELSDKSILAFSPYDKEFGIREETSVLLVNASLRNEWEDLHKELERFQDTFLEKLQRQSKSRKDLKEEISSSITQDKDSFFDALIRVQDEVTRQIAPFANICTTN